MQENLREKLQSYKTDLFHYAVKRKHFTMCLKDEQPLVSNVQVVLQKKKVGARDCLNV
jgi:hypothetical protein